MRKLIPKYVDGNVVWPFPPQYYKFGMMPDFNSSPKNNLLPVNIKTRAEEDKELRSRMEKIGKTVSINFNSNPKNNLLPINIDVNKSKVNADKELRKRMGEIGKTISTEGAGKSAKEKFSDLMKSKGMGIALQTLDMVPNMDKTHNENDQLGENIRNTIGTALISSGNPAAMAIGAAYKIIGKTGGFTDGSKGLGTVNDALNTVSSFLLPGAGWFTKKTKDMELNQDVQASSAYTDTADRANTASQNANAKILFGKDTANKKISHTTYTQEEAANILNRGKIDRYASANPLLNQKVQLQMGGGYNPLVAKDGTKLYNIEFAKSALSKRKTKREEPQDVEIYKSGGAFNVIPEGALHKNKHHLESVDSKFEDVTSKGIPVISESEGGDITQHAEVEKEEIIFRLEVTKKLEELAKENTDDAALEAGKLLVKEILYNTIDKTKNML